MLRLLNMTLYMFVSLRGAMKIVFCGETFSKAHRMLRAMLPEDEISNCPEDRVADLAREADILIPLMFRLTTDMILNSSAKLIHQWGVGLEGVDIQAATSKRILVCNVPGDVTPNADSTAEHAIFLMMGLARKGTSMLVGF